MSRELRKHRAEYLTQPPAPASSFDLAAARAEAPALHRTVDQRLDTWHEDAERMQSLAIRAIEEAAHTYRVALKTDTVTDEVAFDALVQRAIAAHPQVPERMWSKAIHCAVRKVLRIRAR